MSNPKTITPPGLTVTGNGVIIEGEVFSHWNGDLFVNGLCVSHRINQQLNGYTGPVRITLERLDDDT